MRRPSDLDQADSTADPAPLQPTRRWATFESWLVPLGFLLVPLGFVVTLLAIGGDGARAVAIAITAVLLAILLVAIFIHGLAKAIPLVGDGLAQDPAKTRSRGWLAALLWLLGLLLLARLGIAWAAGQLLLLGVAVMLVAVVRPWLPPRLAGGSRRALLVALLLYLPFGLDAGWKRWQLAASQDNRTPVIFGAGWGAGHSLLWVPRNRLDADARLYGVDPARAVTLGLQPEDLPGLTVQTWPLLLRIPGAVEPPTRFDVAALLAAYRGVPARVPGSVLGWLRPGDRLAGGPAHFYLLPAGSAFVLECRFRPDSGWRRGDCSVRAARTRNLANLRVTGGLSPPPRVLRAVEAWIDAHTLLRIPGDAP